MFSGLHDWVNAAWYTINPQQGAPKEKEVHTSAQTWVQRPRPVLQALLVMGITHAAGVGLFYLIKSPWFMANYDVRLCMVTDVPVH